MSESGEHVVWMAAGPVGNAPRAPEESKEMRPLRYSINVTLDGCCHHEAGLPPDEESMRYWTAEM
ncbi:MAG: hypothetical protein ABWY26_05765, partial [Microbacterium sp.]